MLDLPRYLLGVVELLILAGSALFAASSLRSRLLPDLEGPPAHLATLVLAAAFLIWAAELLGSFAAFEAAPYTAAVALAGIGLGAYLRGWRSGGDRPEEASATAGAVGPSGDRTRGQTVSVPLLIGLVIALLAVLHFGADVRPKLSTGMTGFDSTWYHGPFAAGFFQSGDTWALHQIAPQFLAWFYPANAELFHAVGMLAFGRDLISPLLNLGWLLACLAACWCIGRPYGVAPWSLALGAVALSVPALSDQAGEARNDLPGIFFLLAAVALALNASPPGGPGEEQPRRAARSGLPAGAVAVVGLAAGLAAGTKLNFLLPSAVLLGGVCLAAAAGSRRRCLAIGLLAGLAGGGYWYLRNLVHTGNPLPWFDGLGPLSLPAPDQPLGGREGHSVLGYVGDGSVWSDWLLPGLHHGLTVLWPLLLAATAAGLVLCLGRRSEPLLRVAGLVGLAAACAWLIAPTSASGPDGMPRGFESGLRYLAPALVLGLALLPATPALRGRARSPFVSLSGRNSERAVRAAPAAGVVALLAVAAVGYPVQRHYLEHRYANPEFTTPGLNGAFRWARSVSGARIATTSTRQYPLFGTDLSNRVRFVGEERPNGGFVAPTTCGAWRRLLDQGGYDYVIASRDRIDPAKPPYPASARWTEGPNAHVILRKPPTVVFKLTGPLNPSQCPG
jgi:hypothetical protein